MGGRSKLTVAQVGIIGVVVCLVIAAAMYFALIKKQQALVKSKQDEATKIQQRAQQKDQMFKQLEQAKIERAAVEARLKVYTEAKMIPLSTSTPIEQLHTMLRLWREHADVLGPLMERHIASTGCTLGAGAGMSLVTGQHFQIATGGIITVPPPPQTPGAVPPGWYRVSLGNITVHTRRGFAQALSFLRSWPRAPRLVTIGAPSLVGTSPDLAVTVPVTVYYLVGEGGAQVSGVGGGGTSAPGMGSGPTGPMGEPPMPGPSGNGPSGNGPSGNGP